MPPSFGDIPGSPSLLSTYYPRTLTGDSGSHAGLTNNSLIPSSSVARRTTDGDGFTQFRLYVMHDEAAPGSAGNSGAFTREPWWQGTSLTADP